MMKKLRGHQETLLFLLAVSLFAATSLAWFCRSLAESSAVSSYPLKVERGGDFLAHPLTPKDGGVLPVNR